MTVEPLGFFEKLRILAAAGVAVLLVSTVGWLAVGPADPDLAVTLTQNGGNLLAGGAAILALMVVAGSLGAVIAGRRLPESGVFAAGAGLAGLALRGGSMQAMLGYCGGADEAARRRLMLALGLDCILWAAIMALAWLAVTIICRWLWSDQAPEPAAPSTSRQRGPAGRADSDPVAGARPGWLAMIVTAVVAMFVVWMTIARTPVAGVARGQVVASVAGGLFLGAMATRYFTGISDPRWYVLAVPVVALVGYLLGYLQADLAWAQKGPWASYAALATTPPHALARPLPIEYIAVGVLGAIAGFWSGARIEHAAGQEGG